MKSTKVLSFVALLLGLALPALAGPYSGSVISTATGLQIDNLSGIMKVAASSFTASTPTIVLDGRNGGVWASSMTAVYGVRAATGAFVGVSTFSVLASSGIQTAAGVYANFFSGNGSALTNVSASQVNAGNIVNGPIASSMLPSTVAYTSVNNNFSAAQDFNAGLTTNGANLVVNTGNIQLGGSLNVTSGGSNAVSVTGGSVTASGVFAKTAVLTFVDGFGLTVSSGASISSGVYASFFSGAGGALTGLRANQLIGTLTPAVLPSTVAYTNVDNAFSANQTINSPGGTALAINTGNLIVGGHIRNTGTNPIFSSDQMGSAGAMTSGGTMTVRGNAFSVGASSFTVDGGSVTVAYGISATSVTARRVFAASNVSDDSIYVANLLTTNGFVGFGFQELSVDKANVQWVGSGHSTAGRQKDMELATSGTGGITFWPGGSQHMEMTAGGNLGIDTTLPGTSLDVNGRATVRGEATVVSSMTILGAGATTYSLTTSSGISIGDGGPIVFSQGGTGFVRWPDGTVSTTAASGGGGGGSFSPGTAYNFTANQAFGFNGTSVTVSTAGFLSVNGIAHGFVKMISSSAMGAATNTLGPIQGDKKHLVTFSVSGSNSQYALWATISNISTATYTISTIYRTLAGVDTTQTSTTDNGYRLGDTALGATAGSNFSGHFWIIPNSVFPGTINMDGQGIGSVFSVSDFLQFRWWGKYPGGGAGPTSVEIVTNVGTLSGNAQLWVLEGF